MKKNNVVDNVSKPLVNRVANSGLITINLEEYFPAEEIVAFDLKPYLFKELILKEKDFRTSLKEINWSSYENKILLIYCSSDAIIPVWAFMLVSAYAAPFAKIIWQGSQDEYIKHHYKNVIKTFKASEYEGKRVVIKGCSNKPVPPSAYADITYLLQPSAQSIMYGEPCSTVPIFKRPRKLT